jgi:hypothetical protein
MLLTLCNGQSRIPELVGYARQLAARVDAHSYQQHQSKVDRPAAVTHDIVSPPQLQTSGVQAITSVKTPSLNQQRPQ